MTLYKPDWLRIWLDRLNWDIFGWQVYVGDAIESGIDWLLEWINTITDWAAAVSAWWDDFRQEVLDGFNIISSFISAHLQPIIDFFTNFWDILAEWWTGKADLVKDWISEATAGLAEIQVTLSNFFSNILPNIIGDLSQLQEAWSDFWSNTFPSLVSFTWLGNWWQSRLVDISSLIDSAFALRKSLWEGWQEVREQVFEFFTDPLEYLWQRFTSWFFGE